MFSSTSSTIASTLPTRGVTSQEPVSTLVVIDAGVADYQQLMAGVVSDAAVVLLNDDQDGLAQITSALEHRPGVKQLHIITHGSPGTLYLGNGELNLTNLLDYQETLASWFVDSEAELLLYGCNVAAGDAGEEFITKLQAATQAKIAASTTKVGSLSEGGNWSLDVATADFTPQLAISRATQSAYVSTFDWFEAEKLLADSVNGVIQNPDTSEGDIDELDQFGSAVAIFDGYALVGVPNNSDVIDNNGTLVPGSDVGSVYVFAVDPTDGSWSRETQLVADDPTVSALFGQSVDASRIPGSDDLYVAVGAPGARSPSPTAGLLDEFTGAAYIFKRDATTGEWSQVQKIVQTDNGPAIGNLSSRAFDQFGTSVGIDGLNIVVGAPNDSRSQGEQQTGAIYIFEASADGSAWTQVGNKITNLNAGSEAAFDRFGESVAIADGLIIAGSPNADVTDGQGGAIAGGAAYIFRQVNGVWDTSNAAAVIANDVGSAANQQSAEIGDRFGASVDITNGYAIVGSPGNNIALDEAGTEKYFNAGSAYVFRDQDGVWNQTQQLTGSDNTLRAGDQFGISVGIDGGAAIVGSYTEEDNYDDPTFVNEIPPNGDVNQFPAPRLPRPGVAYIYELSDDGNFWEQEDRVTGDDRINGDQFGFAVDVYTSPAGSSSAVVGASGKNFVRDNNDFNNPATPDGRDDLSLAGAAYIYRAQPQLTAATPNVFFVNDPLVIGTNPGAPGVNQLEITLVYDQPMDQSVAPVVTFPNAAENPLSTVTLGANSSWIAPNTFVARYDLADINTELINIDIAVDGGVGVGGSPQVPALPPNAIVTDIFSIDTLNPSVTPFEAYLFDSNGNPFVAPEFVNRPFAVFGAFTEPVEPATFTVDNLGAGNGFINGLSLAPDGQSFGYVVNPLSEGDVFTDVPDFLTNGTEPGFTAITDLRGNPSAAVEFIRRVYDITPPEVTLEALDPDAPNQPLVGPLNRPFTVRATFSEPVVGFELADVTLTPGVLTGNFTEVNSSEYLFTVDPVTPFGETNAFVSLSVGAGTFEDRATNLNNASPQLNVAYDGFRPVATTLAVQAGSLNPAGEVEGEFLVDLVFNEDVVGFELSDIAITNGTVTSVATISPSQYVLTVEPTVEGPVVLELPENTLADLAKNLNQPGGPLNVFFNPPVPEVVSITPSLTTLTDSDAGQELVLTILWSKAMDTVSLDLPIIGFKTAEDPAGSIVEVPGGTWINDTTFEKRFTIVDANIDVSDVDILVSEGVDAGGALQSPNPAVIEDVFSVSMVNPALTLNADASTSPFVVSALFSEDVIGFDLTDVVPTNGIVSNFAQVSASEYTFTLTPNNSTDPVSVTVGSNAVTDIDGNFNAPVSLALDDINDAPLVLAPTSEPVVGSGSIVFSAATGNSIVVSDPDAGVNTPVKISLTSSQGLFTLSGLTGLTLTEGDGLGDERITLTGTLSDINAALEGARFKPFNTTGNASLRIDVDDLGNTGNGGPQFASQTVDIPVTFNPEQDFNQDGFEDIFWTRNRDGIVETAAWSLEETSPDVYTRTAEAITFSGGSLPDAWEAVGTFDFNQDGNVDILWRNQENFQNAVWLMDGLEQQSSVFFAPQNPVDNNRVARWRMEDVADLDGDDQAEVIWRDTLSGQVVIWEMDGLNFQNSLFVDLTGIGQSADGFLPLKWEFGATGDFNGDGRDDIIWRNVEDGQNAVWELDGNELLQSSFATPLIPGGSTLPSEWKIIGSGDYNGDGNADIAWRRGDQNVIWEMNGLNRTASIGIDSLNSQWVGIS